MNLANTYQNDRIQLFAQSIREEGSLLTEVLQRRCWPSTNPDTSKVANLIAAQEDSLLHQVPLITADDLECIAGKRVPILRQPPVLKRLLKSQSTEILLQDPTVQLWLSKVIEIFRSSNFQEGMRAYRTSGQDTQAYIEGEDSKTFSALVSIAHELGHCLVERSAIAGVLPSPQNSEIFAHWLEEWIGLRFTLRHFTPEVDQWINYCRRVDALNLAYFGLEADRPNPWSRSLRQWVGPAQDIFRESVFATPGYQTAYALATLTRLGCLSFHNFYSHPDSLQTLGLAGFESSPLFSSRELIGPLLWLRENSPESFKIWDKSTAIVIPLKSRTIAWNFASTTFGSPRGVTYLTQLAKKYIPPHTVLPEREVYALAENLFHESLHQELFQRIESGNFLKKNTRGKDGPLIPIPWRNSQWHLEHAVHTLYVYQNLRRLRDLMPASVDRSIALEAKLGAQNAMHALMTGISPYQDLFHEKGLQWFQSLQF